MFYTERVIVKDKIRADLPTVLLIVGASLFEQLLEFFREKYLALSTERTYAQAVGGHRMAGCTSKRVC